MEFDECLFKTLKFSLNFIQEFFFAMPIIKIFLTLFIYKLKQETIQEKDMHTQRLNLDRLFIFPFFSE